MAVYTTVTDASGRLVPDLDRDEFEVYDNGKLQKITTFANDIQPINVVMMLDRSVSMRQNFGLVRKAAEAFVERLLPADKARIGSFSNRVQVDPREFTSDKSELQQILQTELQEEGPTPLWNAVSVGMTALLHVEGRRVVLVFTDGMDSPMPSDEQRDLPRRRQARRAGGRDDLRHRARRPDVVRPWTESRSRRRWRWRLWRWGIRRRRIRPAAEAAGTAVAADRWIEPDPGLEKLAAESGGGYFELRQPTISRRRSVASPTNFIISTSWASSRKNSTGRCTGSKSG